MPQKGKRGAAQVATMAENVSVGPKTGGGRPALARIVAIKRGRSGLVRTVRIRFSNQSELTRPIQLLAPLEVDAI